MKRKPYILISPDFDVLYQDSEGCCECDNDAIKNESPWLGPIFWIIVPGIEEWLRRYELATNFAKATTVPSFDWITWHYEGLFFAKAIWEQMPRCYSLYYDSPFEDRSGTINKVRIDENVNSLIEHLRPFTKRIATTPSFKHNIEYKLEREVDHINATLCINEMRRINLNIPLKRMTEIRNWLKDIIDAKDKVCTVQLPEYDLHFAHQKVGTHLEMGRFWISKSFPYDDKFSGYVNTKEFVRGLYLSLMTKLGFGLYDNIENYPNCTEHIVKWKPYNDLKSRKIESYISNLNIQEDDTQPTFVTESFVIFPDWGGCIFWDTMGVGCGDFEELETVTNDKSFKLNVPGLQKWSDFYDNHDDSQTYEEWWQEGWILAKEIRRQLPDYIDLYYMCFDPKNPNKIKHYHCDLPKIIIPKE